MSRQLGGIMCIYLIYLFLPTIIQDVHAKAISNITVPGTSNNLTYQSIVQLQCDFDQGLCPGFQHDLSADFNWTIHHGQTPTTLTGPDTDNTLGTTEGGYIYAESSKPRLNGDVARLITKPLLGDGTRCVEFSYHMKGHTMGELAVYIRNATDNILKFRTTKRHEVSEWINARFHFEANFASYQIVFQSKISFGIFGDIAIDDIKVTSQPVPCGFWPPWAYIFPPRPTLIPPTLGEDPTCGRRPISQDNANKIPFSARVIGGREARLGDWPWMAMLLVKEDNTHSLLCGGTLLGVDWIITAAHCVEEITERDNIIVRLGVTRAFSGQVNPITDYDIENVFIHPKYRTESAHNYDVALIKLKTPTQITRHLKPICLNEKGAKPNQKCYVAGWGQLYNNDAKYPKSLQYGSVTVRSHSDCQNIYAIKITDAMLCAGNDNGVPDTCRDDSGGPLMCEDDGKWSLVGITSWGHSDGCGIPYQYGVYTHVNYVKSWIENVVYQPRDHTPLHFDN